MRKLYSRALFLSSAYLIGNIGQKALSFILIPLYTYLLSPKDFGILALMTITIALITNTVASPLGAAFGRFYYRPDYIEKKDIFLFNIFVLLVIQSVVLAALYWCFSKSLCSLLFSDNQSLFLVQLCTIAIFLTPISSFLQSFIKIIEMAKYFVFMSLSNAVFSCGLIIYLLVIEKLGLLALIYGLIFDLCYRTILCLPILLKHSKFRFSLSVLKGPLIYGYPAIVSGYSLYLIQSGDRYVLKIFDSISTIGLYSFGYTIATLIYLLLVDPVTQGLLPIILKKESNKAEQKQFLITTANYYYLIGIFMALGMSLFAKEAIMILARQKEFWSCWVIVPIITFSYVLHGLGSFVGWGIVMKNKPVLISRNLLISAAVNLGLNFVFIPYWGIIGAAFATLISYIVWNGLKTYYSAKLYDLHFDLVRLMYITAIGVSLYLFSLIIANTGVLSFNIFIKFLILLAYPIIFLVTGFFTQKEKEYVQKLWASIRANGLLETYAKIKAF